jgi:arginyl-tRNA synthetase
LRLFLFVDSFMNLQFAIQSKFRAVLAGLVPDVEPYVTMIKATQDAKHGDFQANCAMSLAKVLGQKPRDVAQQLADRLDLGDLLQKPEIAGPGFINLRLRDDWMARALREVARDEKLGVAPAAAPRKYVIDYSSPNVAKPMHVGHLRSTIIGDALARLLRYLGHTVIADNHLGDWGTQFGMLLYGYKNSLDKDALAKDPVTEMMRLYVKVRKLIKPIEKEEDEYDTDREKNEYTPEQLSQAAAVRDAAREETAKLHAGDPGNLDLWHLFMPWCLEVNERIYRRLDVHFDAMHGESFYNPMLADVVDSLRKSGIAQESQGAIAIFFGEDKPPAVVRKKDGAFTYTTSDLATIRYRLQTWAPDAILYVVGTPQALHFQNLFEAARRWGCDKVALEHIAFGSVLDKRTRRPFKTSEGDVEALNSLLNEAVRRAARVYAETRQEELTRGEEPVALDENARHNLEEAVGIGAVKYADLCQNRTTDYTFDWDKMLAMNGNTGTYMQYAYVRNRGIFRKAGVAVHHYRTEPPEVHLQTPYERALALQLLRLEERLLAAAEEYQPSVITAYLWDLAKTYSGFFQNCPVIKAETPALKESRLLLCDLTARVLQLCLQLLGIQTVERM